MSEAQQMSQAEAMKRERNKREQEKYQKNEKAAKEGTKAGQDPENTNIYDTMADITQYQKDYARVKASEARSAARAQRFQIEEAKKAKAELNKNADQYHKGTVITYNNKIDAYLQEAEGNLQQIEQAEAAYTRNAQIYGENIKAYEAAALGSPIYTRKYRELQAAKQARREKAAAQAQVKAEPKTQQTEITSLEGLKGYKTTTPRDTVYIDAVDQTSINVGLEAKKQITATAPPSYRGYIEVKTAQQFEAYENRFSLSSDLREAAAELAAEAREPLMYGKPANLLKLTASGGLDFTATAYDIATGPIRPAQAAKALQDINTASTPEGFKQLGPALAANPTGLLFSAAAGYGLGVIGSAAYSSTITRTAYKFPSELDDTITYQRPNYVQPTQYPKGTRLYTDYSGELRSYMPASARWNKLVMGGDQFYNDAIYTSLTQSRPTGSTIRPSYTPLFNPRSISPVKITSTTVTENLPAIKGAAVIMGLRAPTYPSEAMISKPRSRRDGLTVQSPRSEIKLRSAETVAAIPTTKAFTIAEPKPRPARQRPRQAQNLIIDQPSPAPNTINPPTPRPPTPIPPTINTPKPPKISITPRRKKQRKKIIGGQLIGFYDKDYGVKSLLGKKKKGFKI